MPFPCLPGVFSDCLLVSCGLSFLMCSDSIECLGPCTCGATCVHMREKCCRGRALVKSRTLKLGNREEGWKDKNMHSYNSVYMNSELFLEQMCPLRVSQCRGLCSMSLVNVLLHESPLCGHLQSKQLQLSILGVDS